MGQVTLKLNGRNYRIACGDGEEARLQRLSAIVGEKLDGLVAEFGQAGQERLLVLAALLIADDLVEALESNSGRTLDKAAGVPGGGLPKTSG